MRNKVVDTYVHALYFLPDCFKTQKMCNKCVHTYLFVIQFAPKYYKTQEMCDKVVDTCFLFVFDSVPDQYKIKKL